MKLTSKIKHIAMYATLGVATCAFTSCDEETLQSFTTDDTVLALKEALNIGAQTASQNLGQEGGYLNDLAVRIEAPEEVQTIMKLCSSEKGKAVLSAIGAEAFDEENLVTLMNQAAETAAPEAAGIFKTAITGMSISDGEAILFGSEHAATEYLQEKTSADLTKTFGKVVTGTFDQVKVSGRSLNDAWAGFTQYYNKIPGLIQSAKNGSTAKRIAVNLAFEGLKIYDENLYNTVNSIQQVNTNLGEYVTAKALDGLFVKVADKESGIRHNVAERTSDLLKKVFGRLDTNN